MELRSIKRMKMVGRLFMLQQLMVFIILHGRFSKGSLPTIQSKGVKNALKNLLTHFQAGKLLENDIPRKKSKLLTFSYVTLTLKILLFYYILGNKPANASSFRSYLQEMFSGIHILQTEAVMLH